MISFQSWMIRLVQEVVNCERHSVVIMDNCSIHNMPEIAAIIREKGAILLNSAPYAPELIPIEFMFKACEDYLNRYSRDFTKTWDLVHADALLCASPREGLH